MTQFPSTYQILHIKNNRSANVCILFLKPPQTEIRLPPNILPIKKTISFKVSLQASSPKVRVTIKGVNIPNRCYQYSNNSIIN